MHNIKNILSIITMYLTISGLAINLIAIPKCLTGKAHISINKQNFFISTEEGEE